MAEGGSALDDAFEAIAIDDEGRACEDIPEAACREEAGNFFSHAGALSLSKSADALIDPKLVLSWLLTHLGAPAGAVGLLVPVREAGALLPQLFTAGALRRLPRRKWAWAAGAAGQGLAAGAILFIALTMTGAAAGWAIVGMLALLALSRSVCSVAYKDVLGKTVGKSRRGRATGLASSLAATTAIAFAAALAFAPLERETLVFAGLAVAGSAWIAGALIFTGLREEPGATEGGRSAIRAAIDNLNYLKTAPQLRLFIFTRGLLTATALAPPFLVAASSGNDEAYGELGLLVFASALASLLSSFVWGRLADRSSRMVLAAAAAGGALALGAAATLGMIGALNAFGGEVLPPLLLFILMVSYQGVRLGRSTHLVDMADEETRAPYTAISNTAIGVLLLAGGAFGWLADAASPDVVLAVMAGMCAAAVLFALGLEEVQRSKKPSG